MKMNLSVVLALSTLIVSPVFAGLNEAIQAFNGADYQAAYPEFLALSEKGYITSVITFKEKTE